MTATYRCIKLQKVEIARLRVYVDDIRFLNSYFVQQNSVFRNLNAEVCFSVLIVSTNVPLPNYHTLTRLCKDRSIEFCSQSLPSPLPLLLVRVSSVRYYQLRIFNTRGYSIHRYTKHAQDDEGYGDRGFTED